MKRFICIILILVLTLAGCCDATAATRGEENALSSALSYLDFMNFSYKGLISQLKYEGYSDSECKYAADHCKADWYDQAAGCAKNYLSFMSFSKSGLISQLEYEGFTKEQAKYGAAVAYGENPTKPSGKKAKNSSSAKSSKKKSSNTKNKKSKNSSATKASKKNSSKATKNNKAKAPAPTAAPKKNASNSDSKQTKTPAVTAAPNTRSTQDSADGKTKAAVVDSNYDLSALSFDELGALQTKIGQEMMSRPEFKEVLVPTGAYKVGVEIPAGKWTITATEGSCEVYWGKALDEYGVEIPSGQRIDYLDDWGSKSSVSWNLTEGTYIVVHRNGVTFTPYIPTSLGF